MAPAERIRSLLRAVPARTMAIWLALIATVFLTRNRWEAWVVECELPPGPGTLVEKFEVSPDASRLLLRYWNGEEVLWDIRSGRLLAHFEAREERWQIEPFSGNGEGLVVIGRQVRPDDPAAGTIPQSRAGSSTYIVDARTGNVLLSLEGSRRIGLSPDGRHFLEIRSRGEVVIRSAETGESVRVLQTGSDWTSDAVCSPDGRWIATHDSFGEPSSVRIWDAHTGRPAAAQPEDVGPVWEVRFSPNVNHVFAALSYGKACCLWDLRTGKRIVRIECLPDPRHRVSDDGSLLLVHGREGVEVWDLNAASRLCRLKGPVGKSISVSAAARRLVTRIGYDIVVYDLEAGSKRSAMPRSGWTGPSSGAPEITPDGARVITRGRVHGRTTTTATVGPVHVWDAGTGELLAVLPDVRLFDMIGSDGLFDRGNDHHSIYRRIRPEQWWGVIWLPHFWLIAGLCVLLAASIWRDVRLMRRERRQRI